MIFCRSKKLVTFLALFFWMGVIFYFSSIPNLNLGSNIIPVEIVVRKLAHLGEYFILAILFWIFLRANFFQYKKNFFCYGFSFIFLFAISDEIHQSLVVSRAGRIEDVFLDLGSGVLGLLMAKELFKK